MGTGCRGRLRALQSQRSTLEEGSGFHGELFVGDVTVHVARAEEADLLGRDRADDAAADFDGFGKDTTVNLSAVADRNTLDPDIPLHDSIDLKFTPAGNISLEGHLRRDQ